MQAKQHVVEGRRVALTNLDKILYPGAAFTKAQVIDGFVYLIQQLMHELTNLRRAEYGGSVENRPLPLRGARRGLGFLGPVVG
jgi:hypothetical protein